MAVSPIVVSRFEQTGQPLTTGQCEAKYQIACYQGPQLQVAYNLGPLFRRGITGAGETIVIVDSYGSPTITHDLATYDAQYGLPAPPSLTIIQPAGRSRLTRRTPASRPGRVRRRWMWRRPIR